MSPTPGLLHVVKHNVQYHELNMKIMRCRRERLLMPTLELPENPSIAVKCEMDLTPIRDKHRVPPLF
jgi:hypothetical protein